MIKILYIHHATSWGGAPNCLINLIKNLDESKFEAEVLLLKDSIVAEKLKENGIKYWVAKSIFYSKYYHFFAHSEAGYIKWYQLHIFIINTISWTFSRFFFAKRELANHTYDIIHLNSSVLTDWLAPAKKKSKVIIHIREPFRKGSLDFLHGFFRFIIKKNADKIIAISEDNFRRINIPSKTVMIYDYCKIPEYPSLESSYSSKKVLYLGGTSTSKGFYTLVDALDFLDKDVKIYFGGNHVNSKSNGSLLNMIRFHLSKGKKRNNAINKIKNHPNAKFVGLIYNVEEYLYEVCCLVSPFTVPHFSCPVIEAHLNKKPAIGSDVEGMDEIIAHEKNGLIFPKNNPKALAEAINQITSSSQKAKTFGEAGYNIAINKFTMKNNKQLEQIYTQI
jgi:glycosyltransferase involved in cell wall biosynthesis